MNTNEKGNLGLAKVIAELVEMKYSIFLPFTDTTIVDLVIGNNKMELKRVQVKYRKINKRGVIEIPFQTVVNGKKMDIDKSKIDLYIIYCPDNKKIYYIDIMEYYNSKIVNLRVDKPKQNNIKITYAENFEKLNF